VLSHVVRVATIDASCDPLDGKKNELIVGSETWRKRPAGRERRIQLGEYMRNGQRAKVSALIRWIVFGDGRMCKQTASDAGFKNGRSNGCIHIPIA